MNLKNALFWQNCLVWLQQRLNRKKTSKFSANRGFTLIELLVASVLTSVVILVAWSGLLAVFNMSQVAEARTARQTELNRALDFMTNEIRTARSINQTATATANGTTVSVADVVTSSGLNLGALGSYGTIGLYLERPTGSDIPSVCPAGGPNAGLAPPVPTDYDRVVYDVRTSPSGWLSPRILMRYGRVPNQDGTINPCKNPISSDPMVDALTTTQATPPCAGVLSGGSGFYSCVNGKQVDLFFQSNISDVEAKMVSSSVSSRLGQIYDASSALSAPAGGLFINGSFSGSIANISWGWTGTPSPGATYTYTLHKTWRSADYTPYSGSGTSFTYDLSTFASSGDNICFWVETTTSAGNVQSGTVCTIYF